MLHTLAKMSVRLALPALLAVVVIVALCHAAVNEATTAHARLDDAEAGQTVQLSLSLLLGGKKVLLMAENRTKDDILITEPGCERSRLIVVQPSGQRIVVQGYTGPSRQRQIKSGATLVWQETLAFEERLFPNPGVYRLSWEMENMRSPEIMVHVLPSGAEDIIIAGKDIRGVFDIKQLRPDLLRVQEMKDIIRKHPDREEALQKVAELRERWRKEDTERATTAPGNVDQ